MTPKGIIETVSSLMNDTNQVQYTNENCLPYLNIALRDLQEIFEQNGITYTYEVSDAIEVPAGTDVVRRTFGPPQLPSGLIEIKQLWERQHGVDPYIPMVRKEFLPHNLEGPATSQFGIWAWINDEIRLLPASQDNDLKIDYIKSMFTLPLTLDQINFNFPFVNCEQYLAFRTASLCSLYIGENETRAQFLSSDAEIAKDRVLTIWTKGKQSITTRRRPFRASYKGRRGWLF